MLSPLNPGMQASLSTESSIKRDRAGTWFEGGVPVENPAVTRAFNRWVDRAADGRYILRNRVNWVYVEMEGAPLRVISIDIAEDHIELELSDETTELLDPHTLREDEQGVLYCDVRQGTMPASFHRTAQQALEPIVREDDEGVYLQVGEQKIRPVVVADPLNSASGRGRSARSGAAVMGI